MRSRNLTSKKEMVMLFLQREDNAVVLSGKKDNIKSVMRYGLTDTMANLYTKFSAEFPHIEMSKSFFYRARRATIKLIAFTRRRMCVCVKHANMSLLLKAAKVLPNSTQALAELSPEELQSQLEEMPSEQVHYRQWVKKEIPFNGRTLKKDRLEQYVSPKSEFVKLFCDGLPEFKKHVARVGAQYEAVQCLKRKLRPECDCSVQIDFAENWATKYQDEPSSVFFDKTQTTIHPMVVHYVDDGGKLTSKSYAGVSEETSHAAPTIFAFISTLMVQLMVLLPKLKVVNFISDSPSSQYRNRSSVSLIAKFLSLFKTSATWIWLEAGHGKGPCDGIGGALKNQADNLVKSAVIIRSGPEFATELQKLAKNITVLLRLKPSLILAGVNPCQRTWAVPVRGPMVI